MHARGAQVGRLGRGYFMSGHVGQPRFPLHRSCPPARLPASLAVSRRDAHQLRLCQAAHAQLLRSHFQVLPQHALIR